MKRIAREGKRIRSAFLEARTMTSPLARPAGAKTRVGLIVPRHRQSAVARNRLKRRLRELVRLRILPMDVAADVVLRARAEAYSASFDALAADVTRTSQQLLRWRATVADPAEPSTGQPLTGGA